MWPLGGRLGMEICSCIYSAGREGGGRESWRGPGSSTARDVSLKAVCAAAFGLIVPSAPLEQRLGRVSSSVAPSFPWAQNITLVPLLGTSRGPGCCRSGRQHSSEDLTAWLLCCPPSGASRYLSSFFPEFVLVPLTGSTGRCTFEGADWRAVSEYWGSTFPPRCLGM